MKNLLDQLTSSKVNIVTALEEYFNDWLALANIQHVSVGGWGCGFKTTQLQRESDLIKKKKKREEKKRVWQ